MGNKLNKSAIILSIFSLLALLIFQGIYVFVLFIFLPPEYFAEAFFVQLLFVGTTIFTLVTLIFNCILLKFSMNNQTYMKKKGFAITTIIMDILNIGYIIYFLISSRSEEQINIQLMILIAIFVLLILSILLTITGFIKTKKLVKLEENNNSQNETTTVQIENNTTETTNNLEN